MHLVPFIFIAIAGILLFLAGFASAKGKSTAFYCCACFGALAAVSVIPMAERAGHGYAEKESNLLLGHTYQVHAKANVSNEWSYALLEQLKIDDKSPKLFRLHSTHSVIVSTRDKPSCIVKLRNLDGYILKPVDCPSGK